MTKLLKYWYYISKLSQSFFKKKLKVYTHVPYRILNQKLELTNMPNVFTWKS